MMRRGLRDRRWLVKHFFQGIFTGKEYWHPEDFWWGKDDLWDWSITLGAWRWLGIYAAYLSMALIGLISIPAALHAFALYARPDVVVWNEFFNIKSPIGWIYIGIYVASFFLAFICTFASYRKYRAKKLEQAEAS